jgi:(p)ppGpp synthase/HD superfamily hydrolase
MTDYELAMKIIKASFAGKADKGGKPYIDHLIRVANKCPDYGSGALKTIALLHDLLEDCPEWNEKSLRCLFSDVIVNNIVALTKDKDYSYDEYISRIGEYWWASEVKRCDLLDNMDITRLPKITDDDVIRLRKYHKAYCKLTQTPIIP